MKPSSPTAIAAALLMGLAAPSAAQLTHNAAFLMDEVREEALARSAAPAEVSLAADLYLLGSEGFERVFTGTNGFACIVLRTWAPPGAGADPTVAPICYNPPAVATVLPERLRRARLVASGYELSEIEDALRKAQWEGTLPEPEGSAMGYMQSAGFADASGPTVWVPGVVFFAAGADRTTVGTAMNDDVGPQVIGVPGAPRAAIRVPIERTFTPSAADAEDEGGTRALGEDERALLLRLARDNERRLMDAVSGLTEEKWTTRATADGWSVAETLEHIAAAEVAMVGMVRGAIEKARQEGGDGGYRSASPDSGARLRLLDRGTRFTTISAMVPNGRFGDAEGSLSAFRESRRALEALIVELDPVARTVGVPHPIFPDLLDGYQYLLQATGHADRHLEQIVETLEALHDD